MSSKDINDGYFGRDSKNRHTFDYVSGALRSDKLFGTNHSGWNPPKPTPYRPASSVWFPPVKTTSPRSSLTPLRRAAAADPPILGPMYRSSADTFSSPSVSSLPSATYYPAAGYSDDDDSGRIKRIYMWPVKHVWPLSFFERIGKDLANVSTALKCIATVVAGLLTFAAFHFWAADAVLSAHLPAALPWAATICGAIAGFFLLSLVGKCLRLLARILAGAIFLTGCAAIVAIIYVGVALATGSGVRSLG